MLKSSKLRKMWLALLILAAFGCAATPPSRPASITEPTLEQSKTTTWKTHNSSFGFTIDLPSDYLVISKEELRENPEILEDMSAAVQKGVLKTAKEPFKEQVKAKLESGNMEIYRKSNNRVSITVRKEIGRLPQTEDERINWCEEFAQVYKNAGITNQLHKCELRNLAESNALYVVTEMPSHKVSVVQYAVQKSPAIHLIFSAGAVAQAFETTKKEFEEIMNSLKLR